MSALVDPETALGPGTVVGEYQITGELGRGGFGSVYAAQHPLIGKRVAIKVLNRRYSADPSIVSRFVSEARAVNQIRHPHIIDIFSFGKLEDGRHYYVMELLAGETLDRYLRDRGRLSVAEAVHVLRPIALALDAAHAGGIAHRDLKPENVFVARDAEGKPFPKLLDFGLAKLLGPDSEVDHSTQSGAMMGTPQYMSPEQCRGRNVDHRTDYYAFGVMIYQLLTGQLPFTGSDPLEIVMQQIANTPAAPSVHAPLPAEVDAVVLAMMAKEPEQRPHGAVASVNALAVAAGLPAGAPAPIAPAPVAEASPVPTRDLKRPELAIEPTLAAGGTLTQPPRSQSSLASGEVSMPERPRRRRWHVAIAGSVLAAGALVTWQLASRSEREPEIPAVTPVLDAAPVAVVPADAAAVDAEAIADAVEMVELELLGLPEGTQVKTAADGVTIGTAPGKIRLPRSTAIVALRLEHPAYVPKTDLMVRAVPGQPPFRLTLVKKTTTTTTPLSGFGTDQ